MVRLVIALLSPLVINMKPLFSFHLHSMLQFCSNLRADFKPQKTRLHLPDIIIIIITIISPEGSYLPQVKNIIIIIIIILIIIIISFNTQSDLPQNVYKYSMNG